MKIIQCTYEFLVIQMLKLCTCMYMYRCTSNLPFEFSDVKMVCHLIMMVRWLYLARWQLGVEIYMYMYMYMYTQCVYIFFMHALLGTLYIM